MIISECEHVLLFKHWCEMNHRKPSSGYALNAFCAFTKKFYQVVKK